MKRRIPLRWRSERPFQEEIQKLESGNFRVGALFFSLTQYPRGVHYLPGEVIGKWTNIKKIVA